MTTIALLSFAIRMLLSLAQPCLGQVALHSVEMLDMLIEPLKKRVTKS